jgi:cytochrome P450
MAEEIINTAEPENIKALLATQFKDFSLTPRRKEYLQPVFGHGIFTTDGAEWEASRTLLRPNFVRNQIADVRTLEGHVSKMISKIPRDGSTVDLQTLFFKLTIDTGRVRLFESSGWSLTFTATEFLFGTSTNVLGTGEATIRGEKIADAFGYVTETIGYRIRVGKLAMLFPDAKWDSSLKYVHEWVQDYVQQAVGKSKLYASGKEKADDDQAERYVFLNELAKTGYGEKKIQDELLNIFLAGRDTTASLLSYIWYMLARRPDVFEKLRAEAMRIGTDSPSFEQIKEMKYLQYVINESKYTP